MSENQRPKIVRLSEIKTNAIRRKRKAIADELGNMKGAVHDLDTIAYCVVLWNRDGTEIAYWNTEALGVQGPIRAELAKRVIERVSAQRDTQAMLFEDENDQ
jgi:hypothetical protein